MDSRASFPNPIPERVRIFEGSATRNEIPIRSGDTLRAFVSIGAGETRVTVLDPEGRDLRSWVAVFGWSNFGSIQAGPDRDAISLDEEWMMIQAMSGSIRAYGRTIDTAEFIKQVILGFRLAVIDILSRTIGSGSRFDSIIFAAPSWLHPILETSLRSMRPNIAAEILDLG